MRDLRQPAKGTDDHRRIVNCRTSCSVTRVTRLGVELSSYSALNPTERATAAQCAIVPLASTAGYIESDVTSCVRKREIKH